MQTVMRVREYLLIQAVVRLFIKNKWDATHLAAAVVSLRAVLDSSVLG